MCEMCVRRQAHAGVQAPARLPVQWQLQGFGVRARGHVDQRDHHELAVHGQAVGHQAAWDWDGALHTPRAAAGT